MPIAIGPGAAATPLQEDWTPSQFAALFRLTPQEAAAYMVRRKRLTPTFDWRALWQEEHAQQFTVSRLARLDLLAAIQEGITKSVGGDLTRRDFQRDVTALLKDAGWWGEVEVVDPASGAVLETRCDPRRLKLIYDTNTRMAHSAGRWERIQAAQATHPYLRYITKDDGRVRPEHAAWHNLTLPVDDPWWQTHWPPNGWGCRCRAMPMSQAAYDRGRSPTGEPLKTQAPESVTVGWVNKLTGAIEQVPLGIDPGFAYNVGVAAERAAALARLVQAKLTAAGPALAAEAATLGLWAAPGTGPLARSATGDPGTPGPMIRLDAVDTDTLDGVREVLVKFQLGNQEGWLPHGVKRVVAQDLGEGVIAATDHRGYFALGTAPLAAADGRSGMALVLGALTKLRDRAPLDFFEEYGVESLWHEVVHNSQRHTEPAGAPLHMLRVVEGLHQTLARQTYPVLLRALDVAPRHWREIRRGGLSYPQAARRFQSVLLRLRLITDDLDLPAPLVSVLMDVLMQTPYPDVQAVLARRLAEYADADEQAVNRMLTAIAQGQDLEDAL